MDRVKYLVVGDVKGNFKKAFTRMTRLNNRHGPFAFAICVGSFFGMTKNDEWTHYIENGKDIPIQVYILGPNYKCECDFYKCEDAKGPYDVNHMITCLESSGVITTGEGVQIAYLSGLDPVTNKEDAFTFTDADIAFLKTVKIPEGGADVLVTAQWPLGITNNDPNLFKDPKFGSQAIAELHSALKPKYHFCGFEDIFSQRLPYCHTDDTDTVTRITRFIALANIGNPLGKCITGIDTDLSIAIHPDDLSKINLFKSHHPFPSEVQATASCSYRFDTSIEVNIRKRKQQAETRRTKYVNFDKDKCWFCLSSTKFEDFRVILILDHSYISLSKGGLVLEHLDIIPISHISSLNVASEEELNDVLLMKNKVKTYFSLKGKKVIFYERYYKASHALINCIPIENVYSVDRWLIGFFEVRSKKMEINLQIETEIKNCFQKLPKDCPYFHVELPSGTELLLDLNSTRGFPLNFGREVILNASCIDDNTRVDWKKCVLSKVDEINTIETIRKELC